MMTSMGFVTTSWRRVVVAIRIATACVGIIAVLGIVAIGTPRIAIAQTFTVDNTASEALTNYLRQNRLPLVGAQIGTASTGARRLVLYGYVATEIGKSDAESKAIAHLGGARPEVVNRIVIQPEIAKMKSHKRGESSGDASTGGVNDYTASGAPSGAFAGQSLDKVIDDIQRYGIKSVPEAGP
jgi:hypothetical protein